MSFLRVGLLLSSCAAGLLLACGDDTTTTGGQGSGAGATGGQGSGAGATGGQGTGASATGGQGTGGGSGGQGTGGGGTSCGGLGGAMCDVGFFCDYPNDDCGADDGTGVCTPVPNGCTDEVLPACACDGTVYGNPCEANAAGVDVAIGGCTPPASTFACGFLFCDLVQQACFQTPNDVPQPPDVFYSCGSLPAACMMQNVPSCTCAAELATNCGGTCEQDPSGGVIIHCPGG